MIGIKLIQIDLASQFDFNQEVYFDPTPYVVAWEAINFTDSFLMMA